MSNILVTVGKNVETVAVKVEEGVVKALSVSEKTLAILTTSLKDEPELKATIVGLITAAEKIIADGSTATAAKGINIAADASTLADAEAFFTYFKSSFIPVVESVFTDLTTSVATA